MIEINHCGSVGGQFYLEYTRRTGKYKHMIVYEYRKGGLNQGIVIFEKMLRSSESTISGISTFRRYILTREESLLIMAQDI